jgi:hypothetical protein
MKKLFLLSLSMLTLAACSSDDTGNVAPIETPSAGAIFGDAENPLGIGGPNQQNQVYVDLSGEVAAPVARDSWDFGFYSGADFRVVLNNSLGMAVKQLPVTDISLVQSPDGAVAVGTFQSSNMAFIDNPDGALSGTAFGAIAENEAAAKVYLVNLGFSVPTTTPAVGSVNTAGPSRGWKKIKIWKDGPGYKMQYANLEATAATTVSITKDAAYNNVFFSLTGGAAVQAEPLKDKWDLNFSTFTNEVFDNDGVSAGSYFYSDFILTNAKAGVTAVKVDGDTAAYQAFDLAALTAGNYTFDTDQRAIGDKWRSVFDKVAYDNVFFIVQDGAGNFYKIKFISMLDDQGQRGFPMFRYALLQ